MSRALRTWYKNTGREPKLGDEVYLKQETSERNYTKFLRTLADKIQHEVEGGHIDAIPVVLGGTDLLDEMIEERELWEGQLPPQSDAILDTTGGSISRKSRDKKTSASTVDDNLRELFGLKTAAKGGAPESFDDFVEAGP